MSDDRTSRARLRDAAIELVSSGGMEAVSARSVAERAGLSQGLIRHHFGSMAALVQECDAHVAAEIRRAKEEAIAQPTGFDPLASLRAEGCEYILGYLTARLTGDNPQLDALVDTIVADAEGYLGQGVAAGVLRRCDDEHARASVMTVFALGALIMRRHLRRHLDVDLGAADFADQPGYPRFVRMQMEVFAALFEPAILDEYLGHVESLEEKE